MVLLLIIFKDLFLFYIFFVKEVNWFVYVDWLVNSIVYVLLFFDFEMGIIRFNL